MCGSDRRTLPEQETPMPRPARLRSLRRTAAAPGPGRTGRVRLVGGVASVLAASAVTLVPATAAQAVSRQAKLTVATSYTQPTAASRAAWTAARRNQASVAAYRFDWSTDFCSDSPDQPFGFDFRLPCARHDFGYRNFKALNAFNSTSKARIDSAFYVDMRAVCAHYSAPVATTCNGIARTYYQAVRTFG
jgi:hypothetical protein